MFRLCQVDRLECKVGLEPKVLNEASHGREREWDGEEKYEEAVTLYTTC